MAESITVTGSADSASVATRVALLEAMMKGFKPPEGFDLTTFVASFNRLYKLSLDGQMRDRNAVITWDLPDETFRFSTNGTTLIKEMLGEYYSDYNLKQKPFAARVLGGDEQGFRTASRSLLHLTLGNYTTFPWKFETSGDTSLADITLGRQPLVTEMLEGPDAKADSVLGLVRYLADSRTPFRVSKRWSRAFDYHDPN